MLCYIDIPFRWKAICSLCTCHILLMMLRVYSLFGLRFLLIRCFSLNITVVHMDDAAVAAAAGAAAANTTVAFLKHTDIYSERHYFVELNAVYV